MQRYKVFVNEHELFFTEELNNSPSDKSQIFLFDVSSDEFKIFVDYLFKESQSMEITVKCQKPSECWETFKSSFKLIHAAGGIVTNSENKVLFIHRLNRWDLPKGKVEKDESIAEAAVREVEEECGLENIQLGNPLPSTYHMYQLGDEVILKETHWFEMKVDGEQKLVPQQEEGIKDLQWFSKENLSEPIQNTYPSLVDLLKQSLTS